MVEYVSPTLYKKCKDEEKELNRKGYISETQFEHKCLLSVLCENIIVVELGAGYGRICLEVAGRIKNHFCVAVEAEPTHYQWCLKNFRDNNIMGEVIHAAVSNKAGTRRFNVGSPSSQYGQKITRGLFGEWNRLLGKTMLVETITLDSLLGSTTGKVLVHMDVQGEEWNILRASKHLNLIDFFIIGIHKKEFSSYIANLLTPTHNIIANLPPNSTTNNVATQDGIIFATKK